MLAAEVPPRPNWTPAIVLGCLAALLPFLPLPAAIAVGGGLLAIPVGWWMLTRRRWLPMLFVALLLLPPVPFPIGDAGAHPAMAVAALAMLGLLTRLAEWRVRVDAVTASLLALLLAMTRRGSAACALFKLRAQAPPPPCTTSRQRRL